MNAWMRRALVIGCALCAACAPPRDNDDDDDGSRPPPGTFGLTTSVVVVVNPIINEGSTTTVMPGDQRGGVSVAVQDTSIAAVTDETGLAVLEEVPIGTVTLVFETGSVTLNVVEERELYDVVVAVRADGVQHIVPPVRYPITGDVVVVEPGADLESATQEDGAIVLMKPGNYPGGVEIRSQGSLLVGAWDPLDGAESVIDGDVTALGGNIRIRGLRVDGALTTSANGFSAGFSLLGSADVTGNGVTLIRNVFEGNATVPSSNAVLVDNTGIP